MTIHAPETIGYRRYLANRKWRLKNKKFCAERQRIWTRNHPGYNTLQTRKRRLKSPDNDRALNRKWKLKNPEKLKAQRVRWCIKQKVSRHLITIERRATQKRATVNPSGIKRMVIRWKSEPSFVCYYCHRSFPTMVLHIDHVIPLSRGGKHSLDNLCRSCPSCNMSKNSKIPSQFVPPTKQPLLSL